MEHQNQTSELKRALQEKVLLDDGRVGFVFSELVQIGPSNRWHCHVCQRTLDSERALVMHLSHPVHTVKLRVNTHPTKNFKKFADNDDINSSKKIRTSPKTEGIQSSWEMTTDVLPGEPVPPGMEDVVEGVCQIQATFDEHPGPLIGLEYIVELVTSEEESEPRYICLLCEKKGDPRSLMVHVTSQSHCLKYISCFFRTAGNAINMIPKTTENRKGVGIAIMKIAQEIEKHYGRLKPISAVAETFSAKKYEILRQIDEKEHFRETPTTTFANYVTPEKLREFSQQDNDFESMVGSAQKTKAPIKFTTLSNVKLYDEIPKENRSDVKYDVSKKDKLDLAVTVTGGENDPIEVASSISSVSSSSSIESNGRKRDHSSSRRSSSKERYLRKRRDSPDLERRKYLYRTNKRELSPIGKYSRDKRRTRSRSRERDLSRRDYRERDRLRRSPSLGRSRSGRPRYEDRYPDGRYHRRSPDRERYERERDHDQDRDRKKRSRERQERSAEKRDRSLDIKKEIESKWDKYRGELHKLELSFDNKLKYFEEKPEKHPKYSEEWKAFWNKRYKEIQLSGKDPTTYDFKPEWIIYWAKRMKEISEEDFNKEREALKKKMNVDEKPKTPSSDLQDISPPTPESQKDVTVDDIKNTWKALTGSEITAPNKEKAQSKRSPSPWESTTQAQPADTNSRASISSRKPYDIAPPILHCLRMLSVLEHQLGSLGPKVMELLSKALILERSKYNSSMTLLKDVDIHIFFETVKEKIRGQLIAGIVMRNLVSSSRAIIKAIETMLDTNPPTPNKLNPVAAAPIRTPSISIPASEPVQVLGIGMIDKMAVAQQIAGALVTQGKTDVTQEELEDLINAVVGIAKASNANVSNNISSAAFLSQLNIENSTATSHINEILSNMISSAQKSLGMESKTANEDTSQTIQTAVIANKKPQDDDVKPTAVTSKELPSASTIKSQSAPILTKEVSDQELKEKLIKFSLLTRDEQQNLIALLKELETTQASRVENLRKYVSIGLVQMGADKNQNKEGIKDGRLSPFSSRIGGANPAPDESQKGSKANEDDDDDDDDYSVEDVYKAASEKLFKKNENMIKSGNEMVKKGNSEYENTSSRGLGIQTISTLSRAKPDSNSNDKGGVPILSGEPDVRNKVPAILDSLFGRKDSYQISLDQLGSQSDVGNNYMGASYKSYQGVNDDFQSNVAQYDPNNFYNVHLNEKNQQFEAPHYNEYTTREADNYGFNDPSQTTYDNQQPPGPYSGQNWQFGNTMHNSGKPPINYQLGGNVPPQGFLGGQNPDAKFPNYRSNF